MTNYTFSGEARLGKAWQGEATRGPGHEKQPGYFLAWRGMARRGRAGRGYNVDRDTKNNPDTFWPGKAGHGGAWQG
jgi:hypothetical protein